MCTSGRHFSRQSRAVRGAPARHAYTAPFTGRQCGRFAHRHSLGFYDFTAATWFQNPLVTHERSIVGPYVDFAGTDEYVITFTVPVGSDGHVLGVAGADLRLGNLADTVMPSLCSTGADAALVNAADRVIVSSSPRWQVGALLREDHPTVLQECARAPWMIVASDGPHHEI